MVDVVGDSAGRSVMHAVDAVTGDAVPVSTANPLPTSPIPVPSGWTAVASASNALAIATRAAEVGKSHHITGVIASYSGAATALLTVKDGATVLLEQYVVNREVLVMGGSPLKGTTGNAVSAELTAGGLSITGKVNLVGFTL